MDRKPIIRRHQITKDGFGKVPTDTQVPGSKIMRYFTPARVLLLSFAGIIILGTLLLLLPQATTGEGISFVDALFTATSATCVTGLVVVDTGTAFTGFGQLIILAMIQIGGLGIMTFSTFFMYLFGSRLSLNSRGILQETFSQQPMQHIRGLLKTIFLATIAIEGIGALLLTIRFLFDMPLAESLYFGIFHAISAFCNAGFSLFPDSIVSYKADIVVNFTLFALIILGGLGFIVIFELHRHRPLKFNKLSLHSRLVLLMTGILIIGGTVLFFVLEFDNSLKPLSWDAKILTAIFQSITTRTAGFNSLDISTLTNPTLFVMIVLMIIGASPGSCGGGIKTTTFAINLAFIKSRFHNLSDVNIFYRRMPSHIVSKTISITFFTLFLIILGTMFLLFTELAEVSHQASRGMFLELLFEVVSAFATVGLSTGVTSHLSPIGRIVIILLMFIGRLGPLTVAVAVGSKEKIHYKQAEENVLVG